METACAAKNTIQKDALARELKPFFSEGEVEVLTRAAGILGSIKRKVEHAKECKAGEEKERKQRLDNFTSMRRKRLEIHLPLPDSIELGRNAVQLRLVMQLHHKDVSYFAYFGSVAI